MGITPKGMIWMDWPATDTEVPMRVIQGPGNVVTLTVGNRSRDLTMEDLEAFLFIGNMIVETTL